MRIEKREKENATILLIKGALICDEVGELETQFKLSCDTTRHVILDLLHTRYISARALGIMAFYVKDLREKQKELKLINVNENIKKLLVITGLFKLIEISENEDVAIASLGNQVGKLERMLLYSSKNQT